MRQRPAAHPAERENDQLAARHMAMRERKLGDRRGGEHADRGLGDARIAGRDDQRIRHARDDLGTERKALFADDAPDMVELRLIIRAAAHLAREHRDILDRIERSRVDQPVDQLGPSREILGKRLGMAEDQAEQPRERWPCLEQPEEIDRARQSREHPVEPHDRALRIGRATERRDQTGQHRLERRARRRAAQRGVAAATPLLDSLRRKLGLDKARFGQLRIEPIPLERQRIALFGVERVIAARRRGHRRAKQIEQRAGIGNTVQLRDAIERLSGRELMRLAVLDHLDAVFDRAKQRIRVAQRHRLVRIDPARRSKRRQRTARIGDAQRGIAAAVDQLVDLREKFDLADATAPALEIVARAERLPLRIMIANPPRDTANLADGAEIERAAPHKRLHRGQEALAQRNVSRRRTRTDEGGALPWQGQRFVIGNRRIDRQGDRRDLGRRAQPQVDAQDIAVAIPRLQDLDDALGDADRGFLGRFARAMRQRRGIEQQDRIDVGGIIEFVAALLAERDSGKADRGGARRAFLDRGQDRGMQRAIGKVRQSARDRRQILAPRQVADRDSQCQPPALQPQPACRRHRQVWDLDRAQRG